MGTVVDFKAAKDKKESKPIPLRPKESNKTGNEAQVSFHNEATRSSFSNEINAVFVKVNTATMPPCFPPDFDEPPPLRTA